MPGTTASWLVLLALGLLMAILLVAWRLSVSQQIEDQEEPTSYEDELRGVEPEPGERTASAASEHIEFMVRQKLAGHPDLTQVALDFGTQEDGSLSIWIDDREFGDVDSIPDPRIRQAVRQAVEAFNE